jgi:GNAT superfamily N-acetyltransferase
MSKTPNFELEGITFRKDRANKIDQPTWRQIQGVERKAFSAGLGRPQADIDHLLDWYSPQRYGEERTKPMVAVERGRLRKNQLITKPRVVVAYDEDRPVGYTYVANNTSGSSNWERHEKMWVPGKHYAWVREIAVDPEYQHRGIALAMGYLAVEKVRPTQPVTAYIWEENADLLALANYLGLNETGRSENEYPFGPGSRPVTTVRVQGAAADIKATILEFPDAPAAIDYAHAHAA